LSIHAGCPMPVPSFTDTPNNSNISQMEPNPAACPDKFTYTYITYKL